jgi:hypothetical protein
MDEFDQMRKEKADYKKKREEKYLADSKTRLSKIVTQKVKTTMIGSLSSVEEHFGFLWEGDDEQAKLMKGIFENMRSSILDKGNAQIRNVEAELSQYECKWLKYQVTIPFKKIEDKE